jgi:hypothetical protein
MGWGVIPSPQAPGWVQRTLQQVLVYEAALQEIADYGLGEINQPLIRANYRDLIKIAENALKEGNQDERNT